MPEKSRPSGYKFIPEYNVFWDEEKKIYMDMHGYPTTPNIEPSRPHKILDDGILFTSKVVGGIVFATLTLAGQWYYMQSQIDKLGSKVELIQQKYDTMLNQQANHLLKLDTDIDKLNSALVDQNEILRSLQSTTSIILRENRTRNVK